MVIERTKDEVIIRLSSSVDTKELEQLIDRLAHKEADAIKSKKIELLKKAVTDPLFLSDINEIHQDFDAIDQETV